MKTTNAKRSQGMSLDSENLESRKLFIGLGKVDAERVSSLIPWAKENLEQVVEDFYDHQFSFGPTKKFFEAHASKKRLKPEVLRRTLEDVQRGHLLDLIESSKQGWGLPFAKRCLKIGQVHDVLNLPLKWYLASYAKLVEIFDAHLEVVESDPNIDVHKALISLQKVFNLEMQLVSDSFLMSNLKSMGLGTEDENLKVGEDATERMGEMKSNMADLLRQAGAIEEDDLTAKILREEIPGSLGEKFSGMTHRLQNFAEQLGRLSRGEDLNVESIDSKGQLGEAVFRVHQTLGKLTRAMDHISEGTRQGDFSRRFPKEALEGRFHDLAGGINELLDFVIGMLSFNVHVLNGSSEKLKEMGQDLLGQSGLIADQSQAS